MKRQTKIERGKIQSQTLLEDGEDRTGIDSRGEESADCPYAEESEESLYADEALMALAASAQEEDDEELSSAAVGGGAKS